MTDCIFCKIINGDFGTEFVYENESAVVFKDINPQADTHLLVVPRLHVESLNELNDMSLNVSFTCNGESMQVSGYEKVITVNSIYYNDLKI